MTRTVHENAIVRIAWLRQVCDVLAPLPLHQQFVAPQRLSRSSPRRRRSFLDLTPPTASSPIAVPGVEDELLRFVGGRQQVTGLVVLPQAQVLKAMSMS